MREDRQNISNKLIDVNKFLKHIDYNEVTEKSYESYI